jgi:hypothetical protein
MLKDFAFSYHLLLITDHWFSPGNPKGRIGRDVQDIQDKC